MTANTTMTGPVADRLPVVLPGSAGYDAARRAWNLTADQRPAAAVEARSVQDVQAALAYAREHGLRVAPQTTDPDSPTPTRATVDSDGVLVAPHLL